MDEMIERVARTLCMQIQIDEGYSAESAARAATSDMYKNYRNAARAAIEAMRMPTEEMAVIGADAYANGCPEDAVSPTGIKEAYQAMIDAALKLPDPVE